MNVLITSASRKVLLVRAFQEALAATGGGKVVAVDVNPNSPALYCADDHYLVPRGDDPRLFDTLLTLCKTLEIGLVVPTRDPELPWFADRRPQFEAEGVRVMISSPETVALCQDKASFIAFCLSRGFEVPVTYEAVALPRDLVFPVFVKPRSGQGGKGAMAVASRGELDVVLRSCPDIVVQEVVHAKEYTIDLFADFEGRVISVVPRERTYVFGGESFISRTVGDSALIEEGCRLARALDVRGHVTMQCFYDGKCVKFIEVNPRYGGAANLGFAAGADTPRYLVELTRGLSVRPRIGEFKKELVMLRYTADLFMDAVALSARTAGEEDTR